MSLQVRLTPGTRPSLSDPLLAAALMAGVDADRALESVGQALAELDRLQRRCRLEWLASGATAVPLVPGTGLPTITSSVQTRVSQFAVLRPDPDRPETDAWLLESGRSAWRVRLDGTGVAQLADLGSASASDLRALLGLTGMLAAEDDERVALDWEPHDRYFASRSRSDVPRSPGYRLAGVRPPEPAIRTDLPDGPRIPLPVPDGPRSDEPTLWVARESRRSIRTFADEPVPLGDLGELLWRTLRVIDVRVAEDADGYDGVLRPVPSGGAMHATDLWLLCSNVEGVPPGVWRYDPVSHELVGSPGGDASHPGGAVRMRDASGELPPIAGLLTVRHARTSWKYGGLAFALELKDVGVIMEAVQLAAGAVGLGMCPWGSGPITALGELLGVDPEVDMPVGEFILGVPA